MDLKCKPVTIGLFHYLEKLMFVRVLSFLDKENVIYKQQFGFTPKHSTTHSIISITEKIREALDKGKFSCEVFVDLQKTFDTVNHEVLLQKLCQYGIWGNTVSPMSGLSHI